MAMSEAVQELRAAKMRAQWARERAERAADRLSTDPKATGDQKKAAKALLAERKTAEKKAIAAFDQAKQAPVTEADPVQESISEPLTEEVQVPA